MNVLYIHKESWEQNYVTKRLPNHNVTFASSISEVPADILNKTEVLSVFVSDQVKKTEIDSMPELKLIVTRSTGYDHVDVAYARSKGIEIAYVPSYGEHTVAEYAFALLLALSRKVHLAYDQVTETGSFSQEHLRGFDLVGKTIGVIGTGRIGIHAVEIAKGFSMNVIAYDPYPKADEAKRLGFSYATLDQLLEQSDIITIHTPYNKDTHHLINKENVGSIKRGAYIINTARGGIIETSVLVEGLKSGQIGGAGLDVFEEEGVMFNEAKILDDETIGADTMRTALSNHYLIDHPRVLVTPHNAFNTQEAIERIINTTTDNVLAFENGKPSNLVPLK